MTDAQFQKKLDAMATLADELDKAAKQRYGPEAFLFFEAEGAFHIMDGDSYCSSERQKHIRHCSKLCRMGAGAW